MFELDDGPLMGCKWMRECLHIANSQLSLTTVPGEEEAHQTWERGEREREREHEKGGRESEGEGRKGRRKLCVCVHVCACGVCMNPVS